MWGGWWLCMMLGAFSWSWLSQKLMLTMPTKCSLKWRIITLSALSSLEAYFMKTSWLGHTFYIAGPLTHWGHFADDTFKGIFLNENVRISIKISLKFVPKGPINNNPALVQIMAWRRSGNKPLSEPMLVSLLTYICVTRPQWVKWGINIEWGNGLVPSGNKPLPEPMLTKSYVIISHH